VSVLQRLLQSRSRALAVSLTQAKRKGRQAKEALLAEVRGCVDSYAYLMVFSVHNLRTAKLKELRGKMPESRYCAL
jgi:mRNA turnover protein 4